MGFPCNDFGSQEPDAPPVVRANMVEKFGVDKMLFMEKVVVNGSKQHPVFQFVKSKLPVNSRPMYKEAIIWNFAKFLVDRDGTPIERFGTKQKPEEMIPRIEELLAKKPAA